MEVLKRTRAGECRATRTTKDTSRPKVSDESQFHQPPQVPSCNAHQLPKKRAIRLTNVAFSCSLTNQLSEIGTEKGALAMEYAAQFREEVRKTTTLT